MIKLDPYQITSYEWLKASQYRILADDPGVGKTHPAIFAVKGLYGPKLIVAPAYLLVNWKVELENSGETHISLVKGTPLEKGERLIADAVWFIISYETFAATKNFKALRARIWSAIIFDEAHRLRGRNSARTRAALAFKPYTSRAFFLTGTPVIKNGGDLFPMLKFCNPTEFSSYWRFVETYCKVSSTPWGKKVGKFIDKPAFEAMLKPYMLRRTLQEVFPEMPPVITRDVYVELTESSRKEYKVAKADYLITNPDGRKTRIGAGGLVSALRKLTVQSGPKDEALIGLLEDIPEGEQIVVFAWYRSSVEHLQVLLPSAAGFHGELPQSDRDYLIDAFKQGIFRVLIATLSTMKEGVNLQNAQHVIFYEQDWVAATNEQAIARLHRRGQEKTVFAYNLITRKSIDESVYKAAAKRGSMSLEAIFDDIWNNDTDSGNA